MTNPNIITRTTEAEISPEEQRARLIALGLLAATTTIAEPSPYFAG